MHGGICWTALSIRTFGADGPDNIAMALTDLRRHRLHGIFPSMTDVRAHAVYLAGPLGFFDAGRHYLTSVLVPELERHGLQVVEPFAQAAAAFAGSEDMTDDELSALNHTTGEANARLIVDADVVLAVLDGPDVDSGTASEIGFAYASGTPIVGLLTDWRSASDNRAARINLQVEYFVDASGGDIVGSIDEAIKLTMSLADG
jgi:nucleoside 2-deoxyribosyltransferase